MTKRRRNSNRIVGTLGPSGPAVAPRLARDREVFDRTLDGIVERWQQVSPPDVLYHYTSWSGFEGIVGRQRLWATDFRTTNDPAEITSADSSVLEVAQALRRKVFGARARLLTAFISSFERTRAATMIVPYLVCFSQARDKPSQWRKYAAEGTGVCIGFRVLRDEKLEEDVRTFGRATLSVTYEEEHWRSTVQMGFREILDSFQSFVKNHSADEGWARNLAWNALSRIAAFAAMSAKQSSWSEEEEWRHVAFPQEGYAPEVCSRTGVDGRVRRYIELVMRSRGKLLDVAEVVLGAAQNLNPQEAVARARQIFTAAGYPDGGTSMPTIALSTAAVR
jgi:DUF2971 family protein